MRVVFIGTGEIGLPTLRWLQLSEQYSLVGVLTQPNKPVGRDQRIEAPPIKAGLTSGSIPLLQPPRIKQAVEEIKKLEPDVIVVMAYGQILPRAVLEIPRVACLNLHASLLPRHRGAAPIQAAIVSGDSETGITVMYMDEGLDTGDILLQSKIAISPNETGGSLHDRLAEIAPAALRDGLAQLAYWTAPRIPQDSSAATYAPKLEREDGLIDWREPAEKIERKSRAFHPWPGSYTNLRDASNQLRKLKILSATVVPSFNLAPGAINGTTIGTAEGALLLNEVQLEGKKRMSAADFVRGHPWLQQARCD
ncbi:MAG: methionyl-tRNA formyltransferase [Verrucomicrobiota bacterium]|nr:methionyl-tRNA formyltransferase [Verrucomicrobiota bacterium]